MTANQVAAMAARNRREFRAGRVAYVGPVCPVCNRVAYARKGGHEVTCQYRGTPKDSNA